MFWSRSQQKCVDETANQALTVSKAFRVHQILWRWLVIPAIRPVHQLVVFGSPLTMHVLKSVIDSLLVNGQFNERQCNGTQSTNVYDAILLHFVTTPCIEEPLNIGIFFNIDDYFLNYSKIESCRRRNWAELCSPSLNSAFSNDSHQFQMEQ